MFTGIIRDIGIIQAITPRAGATLTRIKTSALDLTGTPLGASIACSGVCLTVIEKTADSFAVELSSETMGLTTAQYWQVGTRLNLEPSLKAGDELGGHVVSGHVDGMATLESITPDGGSYNLTIRVSDDLKAFIVRKGSVALDGISLTVNAVDDVRFSVMIIPHTWTHTTLGHAESGQLLNVEVDVFARYVARQISVQSALSTKP